MAKTVIKCKTKQNSTKFTITCCRGGKEIQPYREIERFKEIGKMLILLLILLFFGVYIHYKQPFLVCYIPEFKKTKNKKTVERERLVSEP